MTKTEKGLGNGVTDMVNQHPQTYFMSPERICLYSVNFALVSVYTNVHGGAVCKNTI